MIRLKQFDNGMRVARDPMKSVRSCAMGVWLEVGSRHEKPSENGITHLIEHMLFKGTPRFDALGLADELNRLGGNFNAHTTHETLCLHGQCVDEKAPSALDLISEMLLDSTFLAEELERERNVVLEEYKMYEDNPEELIYDLFYQALWPRSPLGRPILGRPETIARVSSRSIRRYLSREFHPSRVLVTLAGSFDARACMRVLDRRFGGLARSARPPAGPRKVAPARPRRLIAHRQIEQSHFCFGTLGPHSRSPDRYAFGLMNLILGGGMSSRLFKEIREKRGLAYSIYSFVQPMRGTGCFGIGGATSPATMPEVLRLCRREVERICAETVDETELELAKEQIIDSLLMSVESTSSRMTRLSETILNLGRPISHDETIERVRKLRPGHIRRVAVKYLAGRPVAGAFVAPKRTNLNEFQERFPS